MNDSAKGPAAGYIFQFEKALLMLSKLDKDDFISIENVDDIAVHKNGSVYITAQAKHSISSSGTTFQDTSYSLWRTLQIWIQKIEKGIFNDETQFVCSTNKVIPKDSLLRFIKSQHFSEVIEKIELLLESQRKKLEEVKINAKSNGKSIRQTIEYIEYALSKRSNFESIKNGLMIMDNENIQEEFYNSLNLGSRNYSSIQKENIYHSFYGWLIERCKAKWCNSSEAIFHKKDFDEKSYDVFSNSSIINAIFRTKKDLESIVPTDDSVIKNMKPELFVTQIEDLKLRSEAKGRIIKEAIIDYIYHDNELRYIIDDGNYTKLDFEEFVDNCFKIWETLFDSSIYKEFSEYTDEEKDRLANDIFFNVMKDNTLKFKECVEFNITNEYFLKGSFLKLSNIPQIGWHPEWKNKYQKKNGTR
jgi:hypothetical protein